MARLCDADKMQDFLERHFEDEWEINKFNADWIYRFVEIFAKPTWIFVDERLPKKNGKYIVCNKSGAVYQTKFYTYPESKGGHWGQKDKGKNIIAWMPMPEPMTERKEND